MVLRVMAHDDKWCYDSAATVECDASVLRTESDVGCGVHDSGYEGVI